MEAEIWQEDQEKLLQEAKAPQDPKRSGVSPAGGGKCWTEGRREDARELAETISQLAAENASLKETAVENGGTEELQRLKRENEALKSGHLRPVLKAGLRTWLLWRNSWINCGKKTGSGGGESSGRIGKTQFRQAAERVAEEARQLKRRAEEQMRQAEERVRLLEEKANGSMAQSGEKQPADPSGMKRGRRSQRRKRCGTPAARGDGAAGPGELLREKNRAG